jgi:hypothetical protein
MIFNNPERALDCGGIASFVRQRCSTLAGLLILAVLPETIQAQGVLAFFNRAPSVGIDAPVIVTDSITGQCIRPAGAPWHLQILASPAGVPFSAAVALSPNLNFDSSVGPAMCSDKLSLCPRAFQVRWRTYGFEPSKELTQRPLS